MSDSESSGSSLTNLVRLLGGFVQIRAEAECSAASDTRTSVLITDAGEGCVIVYVGRWGGGRRIKGIPEGSCG